MDPNVLLSPGLFLCRTQAWHLPWRTGTTFPNTHEYLILLDCIYAKNGNGTRRGEGGQNASKAWHSMHHEHEGESIEDDGRHEERHSSMLFLLCSLFLITACKFIRLCFSRNQYFNVHGHRWQLWQYKRKSLPVSTVYELYDLIESVFTVCPAPPGTDYINSISLAQPEYQHHRLDFTLPCLPESGPQNNIYTICAFRKMMMVS